MAISAAFIWSSGELNIVHRAESRAESERLVSYLQEETPNHRLLVWGFPSYLYVLVGAKPPSVLAFPPHLFDAPEAGSSGHDEVAEVRKILAQRPEAIVVQEPLPAGPVNLHTTALVDAYLRSCRRMRSFTLLDHSGPQMQRVYSRCSDPKQSEA